MLRSIARLILWLGGWTSVGEPPAGNKAVFIAAPHTSNWDGFWGLVYRVERAIDVRFFAKDTLFWFPLGWILRKLGGIPLNRKIPGTAVEQAIRSFNASDSFYFALSPEGTRHRLDYWKSGFYRIARGADVPLVLGFFDYAGKRLGIGLTMQLTGDVDADMREIAAFYEAFEGRHPDNSGPVRLKPARPPARADER